MRFKSILLALLVLSVSVVHAQSHYPGQHEGKFAIKDRLKPAVYSFDLSEVKLLDSRFKENMLREQHWLLAISLKSLLHSFYTNAGMYDANEGGYDEIKKYAGWESMDCELRGHSTGHILSGLALMYASTGEQIYKSKGDTIIKALAAIQKTLNQNGYISAFPQEFINRNIRGEKVWAPWYTLHKILAGVLDQYLYCNNDQALDIAKNFSAWAYKKLHPLTAGQRTLMLRNEFGGMNEVFFNLYAITGDEKDKWLGNFFYDNRMLDPLKAGIDNLKGAHANTYIPKLLGVTRDYEIEGNAGGDAVVRFFWQRVTTHHSFATGSNSDREHFFQPDAISTHLTGYTGESCNVYNMLKLTRHLYIHSGNVKYADYYEKALFNHILGQQDPATGMIAYFLPMLPGAHKVYSTPDSSFWCCVGTGFENQAKYGEGIYYHTQNDLYINLFIPSDLNWKEKSFRLMQQTKFPEDGNMKFTIDEAPEFPLTINIRYPDWVAGRPTITINGRSIKIEQAADSYISIKRIWKKNDRIEVNYRMQLRTIPANDNPSVAAIAYGPVVLAGIMGTGNFKGREPYSDPAKHNDYYTYNYNVPANIDTVLSLDAANINQYIKQVKEQPLTFKTAKEQVVLRPLYDIHRERYVVYWHIIK
ncbi:glycoside hydrolase family 127 protein [Niabella soli]|uniref:Acetyl-CoA carboxylase n=1 Tax=Niabella soli DSM 19437 TaxID=929713 RepID=W0F580_9BACT|nr:glycoside hydrolase family 127 protein [Niabella soli]AHF16963.1 acetyl-CoA carboxylase [Niabella soli DSM 19437]